MDLTSADPFPDVVLLDVRIHAVAADGLLDYIARVIQSRGRAIIANVNINALNLSCQLPWFREFLNNAELVFCDGAGVVLGARLLGHQIPERITYADWMWKLAHFAEMRGFTLFLLGARPAVAAKAATRLCERYSALRIVGTHHGYFKKDRDTPENREVIDKINAVHPDILVIGFGMPLQEQWLLDNWADVEANVALTGGAVFDYISGELQRAPRWMTNNGLEWLGRLTIEPRRLWKRYLIGNPLFFLRVMKQRLGLLPRIGAKVE